MVIQFTSIEELSDYSQFQILFRKNHQVRLEDSGKSSVDTENLIYKSFLFYQVQQKRYSAILKEKGFVSSLEAFFVDHSYDDLINFNQTFKI